ncbi:putative oxoglutarate iron-dependent oxygenase [Diplodia seriata]|uniref:Putative oxoglutarate iron-dependent oxygenase n=1 Tax=Diplodia seriata TaxID=420778 RepID=A0A0G2DPT6_9PEZI|nr:putative oxoglutarate iron-dependent oxygenase [Diplodia seriata]
MLCTMPTTLYHPFAHNYRINYFTIPGVDGYIAHFIANKTINEEAGGPDDMWTELQAEDLGLRRRPLGSSTLRGPTLTQHFAVNYGMPYKFIASTASRPFSSAARPITATRSRLNWAARHCVGHDAHAKEFNELLALGYFERQKIDYHDDGERGLGPTIATLSVGAPAAMSIRMKAKHYHGMSKGGAYVNAAPMPGCEKYEERRVAHAELDRLKKLKQEKLKEKKPKGEKPKQRKSIGEVDAYDKMLKALPRQLGLNTAKNAKDAVTMHLRHGDIVVMHGRKIQEYYEHAVEPIGKLRFALTCRYIDPDSLKPEDCPDYEVEADAGDYDGSRLPAVSA